MHAMRPHHRGRAGPRLNCKAETRGSPASPGCPWRDTVRKGHSKTARLLRNRHEAAEDNEIHMHGDLSMLADREELLRDRGVRPSLAPSEFSDGAIEQLFDANANSATQMDIEREFVPAIHGQSRVPRSGNVSWTNMRSLTEGQTVAPQPDLYYGSRVSDIDKSVRDSIGDLIIPSTTPNAPASPFFVTEHTGRGGSLEVVKRQLAHSLAGVARSELALDHFAGNGNPTYVYDGNALVHGWTYTCLPGHLTQYVMTVVSPPEHGSSSQPEYHLTHLKTYHITESKEQFRLGLSALRYSRDDAYAKHKARLDRANEHARRLKQQTGRRRDTTSGPALEEHEIYVAAAPPLPEPRQEDLGDEDLPSPDHGSTFPPDLSEENGDADDPASSGYQDMLDQQLWEEYTGVTRMDKSGRCRDRGHSWNRFRQKAAGVARSAQVR
ncbi:hypothetical protein B0T19DRAFT_397123 [Cercophora scortea]|uniref:Uncharacterized protein n=1 Tax=Cercophora scortea TaxID=314031 RepID=A0AAE0J5V2_9PEZI|nr:hypothetical protein B0T19DRAFT_397123 [Cercophora scortea]